MLVHFLSSVAAMAGFVSTPLSRGCINVGNGVPCSKWRCEERERMLNGLQLFLLNTVSVVQMCYSNSRLGALMHSISVRRKRGNDGL